MNFQEFYSKTENRLVDSILSLWATGDIEFQNYFRFLFENEPLLADVIFESTFPWEASDVEFKDLEPTFKESFIEALDKIKHPDYQFPKNRNPYLHQINSWKSLLNEKKSIAVTTGTGSGKTECFMLPVLHDLYENSQNSVGINALFLYPLNALIESQRKRMHAWCSALGGIKYALLTGSTPERVTSTVKKESALPQLISREQIRKNPPQILFTNPTMLEYMLVRNKDVSILNRSQGTLRWILLDEAHTLTGSKAAEMALLIRRVVIAFGVNIKDLRFAITSATVGNGNTNTLKKFMADLCGINSSQIIVVEGKRVKTKINEQQIPDLDNSIKREEIINLRNRLLKDGFISGSQLKGITNISEKIGLQAYIDKIADVKIEGENLLPIRGHFFTRGIGGIYVCTNPNCEEHNSIKPNKAIGTMYTIANKKCNSCKYPLLELIACPSCGNMMLEGEHKKGSGQKKGKVHQKASKGYEAFTLENEDEETQTTQENHQSNLVRFVRNHPNNRFNEVKLTGCSIEHDNSINYEKEDFLLSDSSNCIHCSANSESPIHFRVSSTFTNRVLSDIVLEQTQELKNREESALSHGKKYISFTDSRQGTAKISALINQDSESNWIRYQVYHILLNKLKNERIDASQEELIVARALYIEQLEKAPPFMKKEIEEKIIKINIQLSDSKSINNNSSRTSWQEIIEFIKTKSDLKTLFNKIATRNSIAITSIETYAKAVLFDQFARRLPRERSLENLGLVNIVYPDLDTIINPDISEKLKIDTEEYRDLLKIAADYILRSGFHYTFDPSILEFTTKVHFSFQIFPIESEVVGKKWITYNSKSSIQTRLVLLICAGLEWHEKDTIDNIKEDLLNQLLEQIWKDLKSKLLSPDGEGFKINLLEKTKFEIASKEFLCPVKKRLLDKSFRGYSPWIKGKLTPENISFYKIQENQTYSFPVYSQPFHLDIENNKVNKNEVSNWIEVNSTEAKKKGVWNDLHEKIYSPSNLFLGGEHSAQQTKERLKELEDQFEEGKINILSCSTTMEMGVDIGGISAVVMSNVPPMPANYLQRTGRAGRRAENKSLALTFCAPNPIGMRTMENPEWALVHDIAAPILAFDSKSIVERHVNSLLFGIFIREFNEGLSIKEHIEKFFFEGDKTIALKFIEWLENLEENSFEKEISFITNGTPLNEVNTFYLINKVVSNFEKVFDKVRNEENALNQKLDQLSNEFGDNSPAYKAVNHRKSKFLKTHILNFLAEERFLPNAGLPTGIVDFEKTTISQLKQEQKTILNNNPSYSIERALTEFAPGNSILIDGFNYKSAGIIMKNDWGKGGNKLCIQGCVSCGYQRETLVSDNVTSNCPECQTQGSFKGIELKDVSQSYTQLVEPAGFAVDLFAQPKRVISEKSKPQYLEPLLLNIKPWESRQANIIDFRTSEEDENAQILFYNTGEGSGYSICFDCGRAESDPKKLEGHKRLRGGKNNDNESFCESRNVEDNIILGSKFSTDFTEIRILDAEGKYVKDEQLAFTLGVVLTKALAERLAIEESELGFGVKKYTKYYTIFIYDSAKGGAGYSSQFSIHADEIIKLAFQNLRSCNCETACTKCLIDRTTQWHLENLDRHTAINWLNLALQKQLPKELENSKYKFTSIFGSLQDEIRKYQYHQGLKSINIHINAKLDQWELDNKSWLSALQRNNVEVNLIVEGNIESLNTQDNLSLHILANNCFIKKGKSTSIDNIPLHLSFKLKDNSNISFVCQSKYQALDSNVFNNSKVKYYKTVLEEEIDYDLYELAEFDKNNLFEVRLSNFPRNTKSNQLADLMVSRLNNPIELQKNVEGRTFNVSYYDNFNQSEFSLHLMLGFLDRLKDLWSFNIENFQVHQNPNKYNGMRPPTYMLNNYYSLDDYESDFSRIINSLEFAGSIVRENNLPHYRFFEFWDDKGSFNIRIDGGIAHGIRPAEYILSGVNGFKPFVITKYVDHDIIFNINLKNNN